MFLDDLWLTKSCRGNVISPTRTCSGKRVWPPANLSVKAEVECCFLSQSSSTVFCIPLVRVRKGAHIRRSRMGSPDKLLLPLVLCASEVSESSVSDAVADVLQEHPVFVPWKAGVPHHMHLLILAIFQSLSTACGNSTGSPGWFQ